MILIQVHLSSNSIIQSSQIFRPATITAELLIAVFSYKIPTISNKFQDKCTTQQLKISFTDLAPKSPPPPHLIHALSAMCENKKSKRY